MATNREDLKESMVETIRKRMEQNKAKAWGDPTAEKHKPVPADPDKGRLMLKDPNAPKMPKQSQYDNTDDPFVAKPGEERVLSPEEHAEYVKKHKEWLDKQE